MEETSLQCRYCHRPIAVPASRCPWCGQTIMVICARCKQYTDDQGTVCQHCGAPLEPDRLEGVRIGVGLDDQMARLMADRRRAHLLASGVVAQYITGFFYADAQRRTVLVELFGLPMDPRREAAALLFAAIAYLVERDYCVLHFTADGESPLWTEVRAWDGQEISLEGALARQAGLGQTLLQALRRVIAEETGAAVEGEPLARPRRRPAERPFIRPAADAIVEVARWTVLPDHQEREACREIYQLLVQFVRRDPARARLVAEEVLEALAWSPA
ncbi:MAG: zinc ribbon domain-containing protein [Anaerolineae bacterium]|nr:zinc ribbon domain-containing protein [Anaerolineae bacterium]MDW8068991.1 zinc ribbon domain-containing protein [Anaerolineae bacterium]